MKHTSLILALASWCQVTTFGVVSANPSSCVSNVESGKDYFPNKVSPTYSKEWSIEYHNTYKILRNHPVNATYVLYQCGTVPPSGIPNVNLTLPIPIQEGFALTSTTQVPKTELLGLSSQFKAYMGDDQWLSAPWIIKRLKDGDITLIRRPEEEGAVVDAFAKTGDLLTFVNPTSKWIALEVNKKVYVNEYMEKTNHGIAEWIKYYSVFFNKEGTANEVFAKQTTRFDCTARNAVYLATTSQDPKPKVVWAEFSKYCGGWSVGTCPNFYCEYIETCAAEMLSDPGTGSIVNPNCGSKKYMSNSEFVDFAKDADVWVYPGHGDYYFELVYADFKADLDQMKSVQKKQVYDTVKTGLNTWYEHRLVEYGKCHWTWASAWCLFSLAANDSTLLVMSTDLVLQDVCDMVGHTQQLIPHERKLMRNVFTEPVGDLGQCVLGADAYPWRGVECMSLPVVQLPGGQSASSSYDTFKAAGVMAGVTGGVVAALVS